MKDIKITKSNRKTISLQIKLDGSMELKVPAQMTNAQTQDFFESEVWLDRKAFADFSRTSATNVTDKTFDNRRNT